MKPRISATTLPLPFHQLPPEIFEKMGLWLARREGYPSAECLGEAGHDHGCDLLAEEGGIRTAFQCKRTHRFSVADGQAEIKKVRSLPLNEQPLELIFILACSPQAGTRTRIQQAWGDPSRCKFWCGAGLDEQVKRHPDILREFFDPIYPYDYFPTQAPSSITEVSDVEARDLSLKALTRFKETQRPNIGLSMYFDDGRIKETLDAAQESRSLTVIVGEQGIGKSETLFRLAQKYIDQGRPVLCLNGHLIPAAIPDGDFLSMARSFAAASGADILMDAPSLVLMIDDYAADIVKENARSYALNLQNSIDRLSPGAQKFIITCSPSDWSQLKTGRLPLGGRHQALTLKSYSAAQQREMLRAFGLPRSRIDEVARSGLLAVLRDPCTLRVVADRMTESPVAGLTALSLFGSRIQQQIEEVGRRSELPSSILPTLNLVLQDLAEIQWTSASFSFTFSNLQESIKRRLPAFSGESFIFTQLEEMVRIGLIDRFPNSSSKFRLRARWQLCYLLALADSTDIIQSEFKDALSFPEHLLYRIGLHYDSIYLQCLFESIFDQVRPSAIERLLQPWQFFWATSIALREGVLNAGDHGTEIFFRISLKATGKKHLFVQAAQLGERAPHQLQSYIEAATILARNPPKASNPRRTFAILFLPLLLNEVTSKDALALCQIVLGTATIPNLRHAAILCALAGTVLYPKEFSTAAALLRQQPSPDPDKGLAPRLRLSDVFFCILPAAIRISIRLKISQSNSPTPTETDLIEEIEKETSTIRSEILSDLRNAHLNSYLKLFRPIKLVLDGSAGWLIHTADALAFGKVRGVDLAVNAQSRLNAQILKSVSYDVSQSIADLLELMSRPESTHAYSKLFMNTTIAAILVLSASDQESLLSTKNLKPGLEGLERILQSQNLLSLDEAVKLTEAIKKYCYSSQETASELAGAMHIALLMYRETGRLLHCFGIPLTEAESWILRDYALQAPEEGQNLSTIGKEIETIGKILRKAIRQVENGETLARCIGVLKQRLTTRWTLVLLTSIYALVGGGIVSAFDPAGSWNSGHYNAYYQQVVSSIGVVFLWIALSRGWWPRRLHAGLWITVVAAPLVAIFHWLPSGLPDGPLVLLLQLVSCLILNRLVSRKESGSTLEKLAAWERKQALFSMLLVIAALAFALSGLPSAIKVPSLFCLTAIYILADMIASPRSSTVLKALLTGVLHAPGWLSAVDVSIKSILGAGGSIRPKLASAVWPVVSFLILLPIRLPKYHRHFKRLRNFLRRGQQLLYEILAKNEPAA